MRVSLIGMSNIGKSHWAKRITAAAGCQRIDCDAVIERKLESELALGGFRGLRGMGLWMGQPGSPEYAKNSVIYKKYEQEVMRECLASLRMTPDKSSVIDTTGSVIYTDEATHAELRALTRVVYFEASPEHTHRLFRNYITNPKPTLWNGLYQPQEKESPRETLKRCFPLLLQERAQRYQALAHITIPYARHRASDANVQTMLNELGITL